MPDASPKSSVSNNSRRTSTTGRCQHLRDDGKRCAHATYPGHTSLCHHHLNQQMRGIADGNIIAADILSAVGNFQSASAINVALGKLFVHQITGRISRQDALALAYTCQLLLQTLPAVKAELRDSGYIKYWREETERIHSGPSDLDELTDAGLLPNGDQPLHPPALPPEPAPAPSASTPAAPATTAPATPSLTPSQTSSAQSPAAQTPAPTATAESSVVSSHESPVTSHQSRINCFTRADSLSGGAATCKKAQAEDGA